MKSHTVENFEQLQGEANFLVQQVTVEVQRREPVEQAIPVIGLAGLKRNCSGTISVPGAVGLLVFLI